MGRRLPELPMLAVLSPACAEEHLRHACVIPAQGGDTSLSLARMPGCVK